MGPIRYANPDFDQMRQNWIRMEEFADLDEFSTYLNKLGEFAAAEIKKTLPAIRNSLGTRPGAFKIGIFQGKDFNFIALAKAADQFTLVWSCWQSEEAQEEQERALAGGKKCLEKLAVLALAGRKDVALKFAKQEDRAFMWKAPSVHPLQVLENAFQRIVHKEEGAEAQSEALARYFMQNSGQPVDFKGARRDDLPGAQLAAVKMNHMIEPFYLFRLLVQYTAESAQPIDEELRIDLSSALTKLLHNGDRAKMAWLSAWLTKKIAELGKGINALNKEGERRVLFFVKGGRALNYFLGTREKGENDWDTQVVIDPRLPAMEWYQCFSYVHDTVLAVLGTFAAEFTRLVVDNAGPFMEYLESLPGPKAGDDEEIDENEVGDVNSGAEHASCKAELIDIGIPRRDSPSALEEWLRLSARDALSTSDDGVIYPTREYYLNEYLTMARETFLPDAPDVRVAKAPKRLTRFGQILNGDPEALSEVVKKRLAALPKMAERRLALTRRDRKVLFASLVSQFVEAYNLVQDTELATLVDAAFLQLLANPPPLPAKLANTLVDDAQKVVAGDVCMAHTLAENMREHWRARNEFSEDKDNDTFFLEFVRHLAESTSGALKKSQSPVRDRRQLRRPPARQAPARSVDETPTDPPGLGETRSARTAKTRPTC